MKRLALFVLTAVFASWAGDVRAAIDPALEVMRIVMEKIELLNLIDKGVIRYTTFERRPEQLLFFKDMVVVMGGETVVPAKGAPNAGKPLQRRYTNVWMLRDGRWRLTVRHANNACPDGAS